MGRVTMKDVADAAGVSLKTVSRVLNNEPYVTDDIRTLVRKAAQKLNYRPSAVARALAGKRSNQIALLYDNPSPYYAYEVQMGALERCREDGFRLIFHPCDANSPDLEHSVIDLVEENHIEGLILTPPISDNQDLVKALGDRAIALVLIAPGRRVPDVAAVTMDDYAASFAMTEYLIGLGHREIGFISGPSSHQAARNRLYGYRRALDANGIAEDDSLVVPGTFDYTSGRVACAALLDGDRKPSAIFASNDDMAAGAMAVAHERGIGIPADLSIAGFDDTNLAQMVWPPLTTVHQPVRDLASIAAEILISREKLRDASTRTVDFEIMRRQSTAIRQK